jgi:hypothetical protein
VLRRRRVWAARAALDVGGSRWTSAGVTGDSGGGGRRWRERGVRDAAALGAREGAGSRRRGAGGAWRAAAGMQWRAEGAGGPGVAGGQRRRERATRAGWRRAAASRARWRTACGRTARDGDQRGMETGRLG